MHLTVFKLYIIQIKFFQETQIFVRIFEKIQTTKFCHCEIMVGVLFFSFISSKRPIDCKVRTFNVAVNSYSIAVEYFDPVKGIWWSQKIRRLSFVYHRNLKMIKIISKHKTFRDMLLKGILSCLFFMTMFFWKNSAMLTSKQSQKKITWEHLIPLHHNCDTWR